LTDAQRRRAYETILITSHVGVGIVCARAIDRLNILQASLVAMRQALLDLPCAADLALVDGTMIPPVAPFASLSSLAIPMWPIVHGDRLSYRIACASIVAKVVRDDLMAFYDELMPQYAFARHKGYGTNLHAETLARWGPSALHRMSFAPVRAHAIAESLLT